MASPAETTEPARKTAHFHAHPEKRLSIKTLKLLDVLFSRIYHRLTVHSPPQLPAAGPAILICNHTSALDPMLIQSVCKRVIVWMMAKEYYEIRLMMPIFRVLEVIPVDRGARDTSAMRSALRALQEGRILGVFPEGRIETTPELLPFQPGVAQMAIKTKVPVYPAYLDGTQRGMEVGEALMRRNESSIAFGPVVEFERRSSSRESLDGATATLRAAVERLQAVPRRL